MPKLKNPKSHSLGALLTAIGKAMGGDIVASVGPATCGKVATSAAWSRKVKIEIKTAAGEIHTWLNKTFSTALTIADNASGTAAIASQDLVITNGVGEVTITGTGAFAGANTDTLTLGTLTILGVSVTGGTSVETFTAAPTTTTTTTAG
jgi:hypothetical protein